jgi:hypothetical protein
MMCLRSRPSDFSPSSTSFSNSQRTIMLLIAAAALLLMPGLCTGQEQSSDEQSAPAPREQAPPENATVIIPAGTRFALVLTHPIESRHIHRGDDIYAQITSPVNSGDRMVIPPGTLVQGTVEKLSHSHGRGLIRLQSMSITFEDGYVAPIAGPILLQSTEGYALKDPGSGLVIALFALPAAGAGLGALLGHSVGKADSSVTTTIPPGCIAAPPFCTTFTTPVFGTKSRDAIIGAGIGSTVGFLSSMAFLFSSRQFFMDVGSPVEMTLEHPVTLQVNEVAHAVDPSARHPFQTQPVKARPVPDSTPNAVDHGTCYTADVPGTPPTVIPGAPGPDGIPGPPTVIPGTPPIPGTPYPCP